MQRLMNFPAYTVGIDCVYNNRANISKEDSLHIQQVFTAFTTNEINILVGTPAYIAGINGVYNSLFNKQKPLACIYSRY